jgi:hypothetical protein
MMGFVNFFARNVSAHSTNSTTDFRKGLNSTREAVHLMLHNQLFPDNDSI